MIDIQRFGYGCLNIAAFPVSCDRLGAFRKIAQKQSKFTNLIGNIAKNINKIALSEPLSHKA